jgi:hypothetical protein
VQLWYGGYAFPANAVEVTTQRDLVDDDRGLPVAYRDTMTGQGTVFGSSQSEITAACAALERALGLQGQNLVMYQDNGAVAFGLLNALSLNGVRMKGPNYPSSQGAEYATYRTFSFVCTADYPLPTLPAGANLLVSFQETLSFSGGGPKRAFLQPVNGLPIRQTVYAATPYLATQSGSAAALRGWPTPPPPLWPGLLLENGEPSLESPQRGPRGLIFTVSWSYRFGSVTPLNGRPNQWIGSS